MKSTSPEGAPKAVDTGKMKLVNIDDRKAAKASLRTIVRNKENAWAVHYACTDFNAATNSAWPRITCFCLFNLATSDTKSFSIELEAIQAKADLSSPNCDIDKLEKRMLRKLFEFITRHSTCDFVHWNMRDHKYGFAAVEARATQLGLKPFILDDKRRHDLSRLLFEIYGADYVDNPRMANLIELNEGHQSDLIPGADEPAAFASGEHRRLQASTLCKARMVGHLVLRANRGSLKTTTSWQQKFGTPIRAIGVWVQEHWAAAFIMAVVAFVPLLIGLVGWVSGLI